MKKQLLTIASILIISDLNAQCLPSCTDLIEVNGNLVNQSYNGSKCFYATTNCTVTNSVNFNNWQYLSFFGSFTISQTINVNNGKSIYLTGDIIAQNVTLAGNANLYVDGNIQINNIIANNGNSNSIFTSSIFNYKNKNYQIGDTIFTANGTGNYVIVKSCNNTPLSNEKLELLYSNNKLTWNLDSVLQYSKDGKTWSITNYKQSYFNPQKGLYRLELNSHYSNIIKVSKNENKQLLYRLDFMGNKTENKNKPHIEVYNNGEINKIFITK